MLFGTKYGSGELTTHSSGAVPEELLRQIQLNLRISSNNDSNTSTIGGSSVTKVLISGDTHSSSFLHGGMNGGGGIHSMFSLDDSFKMSLSSLRLEGYVQPLFKVERLIDPKKI